MGKDKVMELIEKFIDLNRIGELIRGIEMMIEIILRNKRIPYGYNYYLNKVKKMRSLLYNRTNTNTNIESVKIKSVYQSASPIAQDISFQPRNKTRSFRSIFSLISEGYSISNEKRGGGDPYILFRSIRSVETGSSSSTSTISVGSSHTNSIIVGQDNPVPRILSHSHFIWNHELPALEDLEIDLYARIRLLEALQIERLPPQLNAGGYEELVQGFLKETRTPMEFLSVVTNELFDIQVLEVKAQLQDALFNLFLTEPDNEFLPIIRESPFRERRIRPEILEFLEEQLDGAGLADPHPRNPVMKTTLEKILRGMLLQLQQ
ncbi:hypothetical protein RND71_036922 [Anisodus tanguticus]|uniref:Uncharacterized protein n=1 Tax=Anisodus tanguticus TaxID=243964 RepID=A0AAE1R2D3_9SOLA|nr:hypothetical protein RND71_036922 [Anisodus tanguticus]